MERKIAPRLSPEQIGHIRKFTGHALIPRISRLIARAMLLAHIPSNLVIGMDALGRPLLENTQASICFSHSGDSVFAAIHFPEKNQSRKLGVDAESMNEKNMAAMDSFLQKMFPRNPAEAVKNILRQWTFLEALYKLDCLKFYLFRKDPNIRKIFWHIKNSGFFQSAEGFYSYRALEWRHHNLGMVAEGDILDSAQFIWVENILNAY